MHLALQASVMKYTRYTGISPFLRNDLLAVLQVIEVTHRSRLLDRRSSSVARTENVSEADAPYPTPTTSSSSQRSGDRGQHPRRHPSLRRIASEELAVEPDHAPPRQRRRPRSSRRQPSDEPEHEQRGTREPRERDARHVARRAPRCCSRRGRRGAGASAASSDTARMKSVRSRLPSEYRFTCSTSRSGWTRTRTPSRAQLLAERRVLDVRRRVARVEAADPQERLAADGGGGRVEERHVARAAAGRSSASRGSCTGCTRSRCRISAACTPQTPSTSRRARSRPPGAASVSGRTITSESMKKRISPVATRRPEVARRRRPDPAPRRDDAAPGSGRRSRASGRSSRRRRGRPRSPRSVDWHELRQALLERAPRRCRPASRPRLRAPAAGARAFAARRASAPCDVTRLSRPARIVVVATGVRWVASQFTCSVGRRRGHRSFHRGLEAARELLRRAPARAAARSFGLPRVARQVEEHPLAVRRRDELLGAVVDARAPRDRTSAP